MACSGQPWQSSVITSVTKSSGFLRRYNGVSRVATKVWPQVVQRYRCSLRLCTRMLPRPDCPRAGQSGLWQNWTCGSIGASHGARFDDHARREAGWTCAFQGVTPLITVPWGATRPWVGPFYALISTVRCPEGAGLGGVSRPGCPLVLAAAASPAGVGRGPRGQGGRPREGVGPGRQASGVPQGVRSSRLPADEQSSGPPPATPRLPPVLRPTSPRLDEGSRSGSAGLGVDPQLCPLVPWDDPSVSGPAESG